MVVVPKCNNPGIEFVNFPHIEKENCYQCNIEKLTLYPNLEEECLKVRAKPSHH